MHSFCHFCITQNVNINRRWGSSSSGRREFLHKMRSKLQTSIFRSIFTLDECVCVCYVDCRYWDPVEWIPSNLRRCKHMILLVSVRWNRLLSFFNCTFSFISPSLLSIFFLFSAWKMIMENFHWKLFWAAEKEKERKNILWYFASRLNDFLLTYSCKILWNCNI